MKDFKGDQFFNQICILNNKFYSEFAPRAGIEPALIQVFSATLSGYLYSNAGRSIYQLYGDMKQARAVTA